MIENELVKRAKLRKKKHSPEELREIEIARAEIVKKINGLVHKMVRVYRFRMFYVTHDELYQEGICGVMHAIEKFKFKFKVKFVAYAAWWIRQYINRAIKFKNQPLIRRKSKLGNNPKFEDFFAEDIASKEARETPELRLMLHDAMKCLHARDCEIVKSRFYDGLTLEEVATKIGITRERVRQLESRALKKLYLYLKSKGLKAFEDA